MGKMATQTKKARQDQPSPATVTNLVANSDGASFFRHLSQVAGITKKEWSYDLRISDTMIDGYYSGGKIDPISRACDVVNGFIKKGRKDLVPAILTKIAGGPDGFNEALLAKLQELFQKKA